MKARRIVGLCLALLLAAPLAAQERFRRTPPAADPLPSLGLPPIETVGLSNGLKLTVVPWTSTPLMSLQFIVDAGEIRSPKSLPGLATCAANMFLRGTRTRSASAIEELIESLGGSMSLDITQDHVFITFQFLEESLDAVLALLAQMLLQPSFSERELALVKYNLTYELVEREKDPEFSARRHLMRLLFQNHPYASFAFGRDVIKNWNLRDLAQFVDRFYRPNNSQIVLVGNIGLDAAARRVSRHLYNIWGQRDIPPLPPLAPPLQERDRVCFLDVPGAKDCAVMAGAIYPPPEIPDRFALSVLNQILGGTLNSRLFMNLRESKNYAKYAFSEVNHFRVGAFFLARALVAPQYLFPATVQLLQVLRQPAREPISVDEILQAKTVITGNFPLRLARLEDFASRAALIKAAGWGNEAWTGYYEQTWSVGAERIAEIARQRLTSPFLIVIAGDRAVCDERLIEFDLVEYYDARGQFLYTKSRDRKEP
jgi:zinc protease